MRDSDFTLNTSPDLNPWAINKVPFMNQDFSKTFLVSFLTSLIVLLYLANCSLPNFKLTTPYVVKRVIVCL